MKTHLFGWIILRQIAAGGLAAALLLAGGVVSGAVADEVLTTSDGPVRFHPINHASFLLRWQERVIYVDPVGGAPRYAGLPRANLILYTHAHGDHYDPATLALVAQDQTTIIAPAVVAEKLPAAWRSRALVLTNGQTQVVQGLTIEAVPAYNLTPARLTYHPRGQGNGYVLTIGGQRFYISGDTEDIPEMLALKKIEVAWVCMNLPYTMDAAQAARAVLRFRPRIVYPYHSRGSDLALFKKTIGADSGIEVRERDWYPPEPTR